MIKTATVTIAFDRSREKEYTDLILFLRNVHNSLEWTDCMYDCGGIHIKYIMFAYRFTNDQMTREKNDVNHPSVYDKALYGIAETLKNSDRVIYHIDA